MLLLCQFYGYLIAPVQQATRTEALRCVHASGCKFHVPLRDFSSNSNFTMMDYD
jgi:hypothetical protein